MKPSSISTLMRLLMQQEGFRQFPYNDTTGNLTIGYGRNLTANGVSKNEAIGLLENDVQYFISKLNSPLFNSLSETRKIVLVDMCFNLGVNGLMNFESMWEAIKAGDFEDAADEILESKAAVQAPSRYQQLAQMMKTGAINE
jgi:lysozyme